MLTRKLFKRPGCGDNNYYGLALIFEIDRAIGDRPMFKIFILSKYSCIALTPAIRTDGHTDEKAGDN